MARITVEDCLSRIPNRFELVVAATKRARVLMRTATEPMVPWENDKVTVVALREIARGLVTRESVDKPEISACEEAELADTIENETSQEVALEVVVQTENVQPEGEG